MEKEKLQDMLALDLQKKIIRYWQLEDNNLWVVKETVSFTTQPYTGLKLKRKSKCGWQMRGVQEELLFQTIQAVIYNNSV